MDNTNTRKLQQPRDMSTTSNQPQHSGRSEFPCSRRAFLATAGTAAAALTIVPRHVLGGPGQVPPSEKLRIAYVGCGTQGLRQLMPALERKDLQIVAVCDPNRKSDDYPEWSPHEVNQKVARFLGDPGWAKDARNGLCGRQIGQEIVNRYYAKQQSGGGPCRAYTDFREMLEQEKDLDAVYNMTPEHLHGVVAIRAMRKGKHVLTHKPISNVFNEVLQARETARQTGRVAQLFCAADSAAGPALSEWIASGVIGGVREVHNWSTRPFWPQGMTHFPTERPPVPDGFEWDLWLGPAANRPYHPAYTHAVFRGWCDFGTGALGDMGHYSFHQIFEALKLGSPATVEASRSHFWAIENGTWRRQSTSIAYPQASVIHWEFPARGEMPPVALHWYDGGIRPPLPEELERDGESMPDEGMLFVGDRGKILAGFTGEHPRLIPQSKAKAFQVPKPNLPRPTDELEQFIHACKGGPQPDASFEKAYPFAEAILLGTIAQRVNGKLRWDSARSEFVNSPEANALRARINRNGWES